MVAETESKNRGCNTLKFLCSYSGMILPRTTDGKLRYVGGVTRVLSVDRSISFAELMVKLGEFCGSSVELRCQLPYGDLETLISIKSDEDLANIIDEYDHVGSGKKIRAVLSPPSSLKHISPPSSVDLSPKSPFSRCRFPSGVGSVWSFPASLLLTADGISQSPSTIRGGSLLRLPCAWKP